MEMGSLRLIPSIQSGYILAIDLVSLFELRRRQDFRAETRLEIHRRAYDELAKINGIGGLRPGVLKSSQGTCVAPC